jgi:hypothetical protein
MNTAGRCPNCGEPIEAGRDCQHCLLRLGLADSPTATQAMPPMAGLLGGAYPSVNDRIGGYHLLSILVAHSSRCSWRWRLPKRRPASSVSARGATRGSCSPCACKGSERSESSRHRRMQGFAMLWKKVLRGRNPYIAENRLLQDLPPANAMALTLQLYIRARSKSSQLDYS